MGADVTGVDFSDKAIELVSQLSVKKGIEAEFINCNIYDLPEHLDREFDIVSTSYGVLCWLNDINGWAKLVENWVLKDNDLPLMYSIKATK